MFEVKYACDLKNMYKYTIASIEKLSFHPEGIKGGKFMHS